MAAPSGALRDIQQAWRLTGPYIPVLAALSGIINVLGLASSIYMLQVYDRVLTSHSVSTLVALSIVTFAVFALQGLLETTRSQILTRVAAKVELKLARKAQQAAIELPLRFGARAQAFQPVRDVETLRAYLGSQGPSAFLDLPWMPIFLIFLFAVHPLLGSITLLAIGFLIALTLYSERKVRASTEEATRTLQARARISSAAERNAEVLTAMGFTDRVLTRFEDAAARHLNEQHQVFDTVNGLSSFSKLFRVVLQSALLGVGAWLAIAGEITGGMIIASSILSGRALQPIDGMIAHWKSLSAAREALPRLSEALSLVADKQAPLPLPAPKTSLKLSNVSAAIPGQTRMVLSGIDLAFSAGSNVALIGPSAAGKSSLARILTGVWRPVSGAVLLDNASLEQWDRTRLGQHIGYLPQDVELFEGTIAENISRFDPEAKSETVLAAAKAAGVHDMILALPQGYETSVGAQGSALSAGQRQRIGLARALYGDPFLVVLDEPNSNLDAEGDAALMAALAQIKARRGIAILISHRTSIMSAVDTVVVLSEGRVAKAGPRDEVAKSFIRPNQVNENAAQKRATPHALGA